MISVWLGPLAVMKVRVEPDGVINVYQFFNSDKESILRGGEISMGAVISHDDRQGAGHRLYYWQAPSFGLCRKHESIAGGVQVTQSRMRNRLSRNGDRVRTCV